MLADDEQLRPRPAADIAAEALTAGLRQADPESAIAAIRATRRRELFRISAADCLGLLSIDEVGQALSHIADATIQAALAVATQVVRVRRKAGRGPGRVRHHRHGPIRREELGYGSDADVMFVYRGRGGIDDKAASDAALGVANELSRLLALPSADPPIDMDADLRPEDATARWLVRWRPTRPTTGGGRRPGRRKRSCVRAAGRGSPALQDAFIEVIDPIRYPRRGVPQADLVEMRRLKARMEAERMPRGADPALHVKLGRGGLSDVEWVAQLLQLQHGHEIPELRTTQTVSVLEHAASIGLIGEQDCQRLVEAWRLASSIPRRSHAQFRAGRGLGPDRRPHAGACGIPSSLPAGRPRCDVRGLPPDVAAGERWNC